MSTSSHENESVRQLVIDTILGPEFRRATFGGAGRGVPSPWVRVAISPVELRGERYLRFSYFDRTKNNTHNFRGQDITTQLHALLKVGFANIHLSTCTEDVDIRATKKGKILIGRRKVESIEPESPPPHNRVKDVPLPEGCADRLLEAMGMLTRDGSVRPTMRAKYTQINEFLKHLAHVLDERELRSLGRPARIVDCGCGSSYLTFAVHHYLNDLRGIPAEIVGVDVKEEVIRKSVERSEHLGAGGLTFSCLRIAALDSAPDIVLSLHACDTATDDAIAQAIAAGAKVLLSVPCCHHDLNDRLRPEGPAAVLRPLLRHGILHQRTADLLTDTFRALVLRIMGYRTDVVEFINPEFTARNLMIRAVRGALKGEDTFVQEYVELRRFWGVAPYIEEVLGDSLRCLLSESR